MIKKVIRRDLPETNSSSSHSVVISLDKSGIMNKEEWNLDIDDNGILHIPVFSCFGREFFSTNTVLGKLQYLSCIYINSYYKDRARFGKQTHKFVSVIKGILGIKGVVFEEAAEFYKDLKEGVIGPEDREYYEFPSIDHQSHDIFPEIIESEETIKNFLLNRNSWLYGGSDEVREDPRVYAATEIFNDPIACISAELGGDIGRVDVEITPELRDLRDELKFFSNFKKTNDTWEIDDDHFSFIDIDLESDGTELYVLRRGYGRDPNMKLPVSLEIYNYECFSI